MNPGTESPGIHICSLFVAFLTWFLIVLGSFLVGRGFQGFRVQGGAWTPPRHQGRHCFEGLPLWTTSPATRPMVSMPRNQYLHHRHPKVPRNKRIKEAKTPQKQAFL
eukprot:3398423-Amphidinium_carterae.1